eukprot:CAMPEP_0194141068 /NCGR_PEP_ID=MMETSP0152-20130528/10552_1 /TAXON_ID=1049557 /ORGANISM="Thalassiothrix antarctica, Strain L6-D1" /LENGTH=311 /DNA_ID=CAMNT_0038839583 /DNA_START=21 /DNA_END=956 /DNA_ORIENTATION=-
MTITGQIIVAALFVWSLPFVSGFTAPEMHATSFPRPTISYSSSQLHEKTAARDDVCHEEGARPHHRVGTTSRRSLFEVSTATCFSAFVSLSLFPDPSLAASKGKIVVFGGSGYVGAYVSETLASKGYSVVSVSRKSPTEQADKVSKILGTSLAGVDYVSLDAASADLAPVLAGSLAAISCVGVAPGGGNQRNGNGAVNVRIADAAKAASVPRFVYVSVASELANGPAKFLLGDYLKGKAEAEKAVQLDFPDKNSLVVKPAIIAGGPPGELRPPGPPGMKAASVQEVAKVVVAGALGEQSGIIDGNSAIAAF